VIHEVARLMVEKKGVNQGSFLGDERRKGFRLRLLTEERAILLLCESPSVIPKPTPPSPVPPFRPPPPFPQWFSSFL